MTDATGDFELWLEPEHVDDEIDDFCNVRVELPDATAYALTVWTFDYFQSAVQRSDPGWPELQVGYARAPDLFVRALDRPTIEAAVVDMLASGGLPDSCLVDQDGSSNEAATSDGAWQELEEAERSALWDRFEAAFSFEPADWHEGQPVIEGPAIHEPAGSVTFDLTHATSTWAVHAINALVVWALGQVSGDDDPAILVLDRQHPAYRFWPRRSALYGDAGPFPYQVFPFPDGDYYAFVTDDLREGTFGHPWEHSLCVFGDRLVPLLRPALSSLAPVLREASS